MQREPEHFEFAVRLQSLLAPCFVMSWKNSNSNYYTCLTKTTDHNTILIDYTQWFLPNKRQVDCWIVEVRLCCLTLQSTWNKCQSCKPNSILLSLARPVECLLQCFWIHRYNCNSFSMHLSNPQTVYILVLFVTKFDEYKTTTGAKLTPCKKFLMIENLFEPVSRLFYHEITIVKIQIHCYCYILLMRETLLFFPNSVVGTII